MAKTLENQVNTEILEKIRSNGIVGAGGAGFPTYVKLGRQVNTIIVNGAECEPLLASDKYLMQYMSEKIVKGLEIVMSVTHAKNGYIVFKSKYSSKMQQLIKITKKIDYIDIFQISDFYPAGDEVILIYEVTGKTVPEGGIPPDIGCVVNNVETVLNIYEAVENNKPVTRRYLTCTGEVKTPSIVHAHIGVPVGEIISLCGGPTIDDFKIIIGGPMMGYIESDENEPITKITNSIIVLPSDHKIVREKSLNLEYIVKMAKSVCCQCTECTELCPRYLIGYDLKPHLIMRQISYGIDFPSEVIENAFLCSECGLCEYTCPMGLSPRKINSKIKGSFSTQNYIPHFQRRNLSGNNMREYRKIPTQRLIQRLNLEKYSSVILRTGVETNPDRVEIMLKQHIGNPAQAILHVGDTVEEGRLIAKIPEDSIGSTIHSSIDGKVVYSDEERIIIER